MAFKNKGVAFIVGAVAGTVVGSVTALLLAPKSGKELRGDIKAGTEKVIEAGSDAVDHVSETVYEVSKKLEDRTAKAVNSAKQGVQHAVAFVKRSKVNGTTDAGSEAGSDLEEAVAIDTDKTAKEAVEQSDAQGLEQAEASASETGTEAQGESDSELEAATDASQAEKSKQQQEESVAIVQ